MCVRRASVAHCVILAAALAAAALPAVGAAAQEAPLTPLAPPPQNEGRANRYVLVEEFTASPLEAGEVKLGTDVDVGLTERWMLGTDVVAAAVGATTLQTKLLVFENAEHQVALNLRAAYLSKSTLLWGSVNEHFDELDARIVRPGVAWTNHLSPRLKLHTFWAKGFGKIRARLSEKGRRKLWETKHPGADYDKRNQRTKAPAPEDTDSGVEPDEGAVEEVHTDENQAKPATQESALTSQSIQVQSITGLAQERFQLTGEFSRRNGNKVLVTSRIEQTEFEELKSNFFRLTTAHQWIWSSFQMRLGIGLQYYVLSGRDLDGEQIDAAGVQPASDIGFYWRF
jgi:hypothetical protein